MDHWWVRNVLRVSAGLKDVWREDRDEDVGACLLRILDLVDLNFLRKRCGRIVGNDGMAMGNLEREKKRWFESPSRR